MTTPSEGAARALSVFLATLTLVACQDKPEPRLLAPDLAGYYLLSFSVTEEDTTDVGGYLALLPTSDSSFFGTFWPDEGTRAIGRDPLRISDGTVSGSDSIGFVLGSPARLAAFGRDSQAAGLWNGVIRVTRFGRSTAWPATLAFHRELLGGTYLLDLHYTTGTERGRFQGTLQVTDSSPSILGVTGPVMNFRSDADRSPYIRSGDSLKVAGHILLSRNLSYEVTLPLFSQAIRCSGGGLEASGGVGRCAFGRRPESHVPFTLWRVPDDWIAASEWTPHGDTLTVLRLFEPWDLGCGYHVAAYPDREVSTPWLSVPCLGSDERVTPPGKWQTFAGEAALFTDDLFNFNKGLLAIFGDSLFFHASPDWSKVSLPEIGGLQFVGSSPPIVKTQSGRLFQIEYDWKQKDLNIQELPVLPSLDADSAEVFYAGRYVVRWPDHKEPAVLQTFALAQDPLGERGLDLLKLEGETWQRYPLGEATYAVFRANLTQAGDRIYLYAPFYGRIEDRKSGLYVIDVRSARLQHFPVELPSDLGGVASCYKPTADMDTLYLLLGCPPREGGVFLRPKSWVALYKLDPDQRLIPLLDLRVQTDTGYVFARAITAFDGKSAWLEGNTVLRRK